MRKNIYKGLLFSVLAIGVSYGQVGQLKKADKQYSEYEYMSAIAIYERIAEKGKATPEVYERLGNAYYFNAKLPEAAKWYNEYFSLLPSESEINPELYFRYAQSLKSIEDYQKAEEYMDKFYKTQGTDYRAQLYKENRDYLSVIESNSYRYDINLASEINTEYSEYGATVYNKELIFASTMPGKGRSYGNLGWNNQGFSQLYASSINAEHQTEHPKLFSKALNTKLSEATPVFTKDGKTVYFTRNNHLDGKTGKSSDKSILLKLYRATLIDGKWTNVTELPFNSNEYSVGHPALSADERTLYFVSDMPGSLGDADIWKVEIKTNGFGEPENLGTPVNTEAKEMFPFVVGDELYYASNGHPGLGGLDIFVTRIEENRRYRKPINVGKPINSSMDDFAYYIDKNTKRGFFTSNRIEGGVGDDDIYQFLEHKEIIFCEQSIAGVVTDRDTKEPIEGATVTLMNAKGKVIATTTSDAQGNYTLEDKENILCESVYSIRFIKDRYDGEEASFGIGSESGVTRIDAALKLNMAHLIPGTDLATALNIPVIHFDLDKSNIRPDAEAELKKVLEVLHTYPQMKLEIGSHTDSRASHAYNQKLSERRAKSTRDWLLAKGIAADRLTAKGYGETKLVNKCADGVQCTEAEHQANRRSTFTIVSMGE